MGLRKVTVGSEHVLAYLIFKFHLIVLRVKESPFDAQFCKQSAIDFGTWIALHYIPWDVDLCSTLVLLVFSRVEVVLSRVYPHSRLAFITGYT